MRSLIATGIVIVGAAMATAAQIGMWRVASYGALTVSVKMRQSV